MQLRWRSRRVRVVWARPAILADVPTGQTEDPTPTPHHSLLNTDQGEYQELVKQLRSTHSIDYLRMQSPFPPTRSPTACKFQSQILRQVKMLKACILVDLRLPSEKAMDLEDDDSEDDEDYDNPDSMVAGESNEWFYWGYSADRSG